MTQILTRFRIKYSEGADILYTSDLGIIKKLGLKHDKEFLNLTEIGVGTILKFEDGKEVRVSRLYSYFYDEIQQIEDGYGINLYGYGENLPYNYEVTLYVDPV